MRPTLNFRPHCEEEALPVPPAGVSVSDFGALSFMALFFSPENLGRRSYMSMRRIALVLFAVFLMASLPGWSQNWPQWGRNPQHTGAVNVPGQRAQQMLDDVIYDPFVDAEKADPDEAGDLLVHYQVPLLDGDDVYMEFKTGTFTSLETWETQIWNEKKLDWSHGHLVEKWSFESDWKPAPFLSLVTGNGPFWEPVFHAVLVGDYVYIP